MSVSLVFVTGLMVAFLGWLLLQSLRVQPWVAQSVGEVAALPQRSPNAAPRVALAVFLAVVTSIFALAMSAYVMRMSISADWTFFPTPRLAWVNTGFLVLGSLALEAARRSVRSGRMERMRLGMGVGAVAAVAFLSGQLLLWRQLDAAGYYLSTEPGSAFFAMFSGLHGVHLVGGLGALVHIVRMQRRSAALAQVREAVSLCAWYWHYLLALWVVLFVALFVGAEPLYALCRG